HGGEFSETKESLKYIVWSESLQIPDSLKDLITSTMIGEHFGISPNNMNYILSELGWLKPGLKGWLITEQGLKHNGWQMETFKTGIPFVKWQNSILKSKVLIESIEHIKGNVQEDIISEQTTKDIEFRKKYPAEHRTTDGHYVRSKAEMIIDNWLYMTEIAHAYERKLPIEEPGYCDFYIPKGKVYIEYWGYENDENYLERKKKKIELYNKYNFHLIELDDKAVKNLDDVLPRLLRKYGVQAY
ncbi:MAG: hypothetical protein L3J12_08475, partial [Spirochaetales bacterium]|nr:hypothetical protein [Spirochaetales bacterium]